MEGNATAQPLSSAMRHRLGYTSVLRLRKLLEVIGGEQADLGTQV